MPRSCASRCCWFTSAWIPSRKADLVTVRAGTPCPLKARPRANDDPAIAVSSTAAAVAAAAGGMGMRRRRGMITRISGRSSGVARSPAVIVSTSPA